MQMVTECCASLQVSSMIADSITEYEASRKSKIVALRVLDAQLLANDEDSWIVVEWIQEDYLKCLVIFHFDNPAEPGSWLMHSGRDVGENTHSIYMWKDSRVDYNVAEISHLKTLFGVAQHLQGVLEWTTADAIILYGKQDLSNVSNEEFRPCASDVANLEGK